MQLTVSPVASLQGELRPPSDKSLTHRAYMLAAIADGPSIVESPLQSEDCQATLTALQMMGLVAEPLPKGQVRLIPSPMWREPGELIDCGNSGTTIRLLCGLIASRNLRARLSGDASLQRRPMGRIASPLRQMGAGFEGESPPITVIGNDHLRAIHYESPVASAQVKSAILFAALRADRETTVSEPSLSRDHTERMLRAMGAIVESTGGQGPSVRPGIAVQSRHTVVLSPCRKLHPFQFAVPGDISSAAFFMVAAAILPEGALTVRELSVNPTRTGILDVFEQCGIGVSVGEQSERLGEPVADLEIRSSRDRLRPFTIEGALVPRLIDEIPILAVLASQCSGTSHVRDAAELRVKESDRIETIAAGLRAMGAPVEVHHDGFSVTGPVGLKGAVIDAKGDHRIAMAFAIAGLIAEGDTVLDGAEAIGTSFPSFRVELERLCVV